MTTRYRSHLFSFAAAALLFAPPAFAQASDGYPPEALRLGLEGRTAFRATIGSDGRAKQCEVTQSSGHELLDTATCTKVIDHARFEPARDESGRKTSGYYDGSISWKID